MEIFRSSAVSRCLGCLGCLVCLACSPHNAQEASAPAPGEVAQIARATIEHLAPQRDFVGPAPAQFEWTAAKGVGEYAITVENEVDVLLFQARTRAVSVEWPKGSPLDPGTYFWRVVGLSEGRRVADSGRAAFVVTARPES